MGFEPTSPFGRTAFRERRLKPLGNLSNVFVHNLISGFKKTAFSAKGGPASGGRERRLKPLGNLSKILQSKILYAFNFILLALNSELL